MNKYEGETSFGTKMESVTPSELNSFAQELKRVEALRKRDEREQKLVSQLDTLAELGQREMIRGTGITLPLRFRSTRALRNGLAR